ncbi:hypothetical protein WKI13_19075 [Teredinibacter turnerae]|uniref:hypothetical protein n=1 Tax=Teredinibacter turnerae TaxID=2426 RepID=UPI000364CA90|nr:hypothetical protein [Teredinibacter turnerae]
MMIKQLLALVLAWGCAIPGFAALSTDKEKPTEIDLAKNYPVILRDSDVEGTFYVRVINIPPGVKDYFSVEITAEKIEVEALKDPRSKSTDDSETAMETAAEDTNTKGAADPCSDLKTATKKLQDETNPAMVGFHLTQVKTLLDAEQCRTSAITYAAKSAIESTQSAVFKVSVAHGERVTLLIKTQDKDKKLTRSFYEHVISGVQEKFYTHVGFTFLKNQGTEWYSKPTVADDGKTTYTVARQESQDDILYVPTALFTMPMGSRGKTVEYGITAGLGVNNSNVVVVLGGSLIIKQNVLVSLLVGVQEQSSLNGGYANGQALGETAVDSDALNGKEFRGTVGLSVGYRFGK